MRFYQKNEITLSEDTSTDPKKIRFKTTDEVTETTALVDGGGDSKTYPIGTHAVDLGNITTGKWFYIYSDKAIKLNINGLGQLDIPADKASQMWADFTSLEIETTEESRISVAVAGD